MNIIEQVLRIDRTKAHITMFLMEGSSSAARQAFLAKLQCKALQDYGVTDPSPASMRLLSPVSELTKISENLCCLIYCNKYSQSIAEKRKHSIKETLNFILSNCSKSASS